MKYNKRIKNKNIGYFLVGKRVFNSLRKAEQYCEINKLDVDDCILSEDTGVLMTAKDVCNDVLPLLYDINNIIQEVYEKQHKDFERKAKEYNESKEVRDLLRDLKKEYMSRSLGVLDGIHMIRRIINEQIEIHEAVKRKRYHS